MSYRTDCRTQHRGIRWIVYAALALPIVCGAVRTSAAVDPVTIKLWENGAPGTPATKPEDEPVLLMTPPMTKCQACRRVSLSFPAAGTAGSPWITRANKLPSGSIHRALPRSCSSIACTAQVTCTPCR